MNEKIDTILFPRIQSKNSISVLKHHTIFKIQCKQRLLQSSNSNMQSPERPTKQFTYSYNSYKTYNFGSIPCSFSTISRQIVITQGILCLLLYLELFMKSNISNSMYYTDKNSRLGIPKHLYFIPEKYGENLFFHHQAQNACNSDLSYN